MRKRLLRLVRLAAFALFVTVVLLPFLLGVIGMLGMVYAPCGDPGLTPASYGLPYQDIQISMRSGTYAGFFIPGVHTERATGDPDRRQGTIIIPPNYSVGRSSMLHEAAPLANAGYNILMYESRRCGGRALSLGYRDGEDIADALAFLRENAGSLGVDSARVALHGFSSAGAAVTMAAAALPEIRGVVSEGGYHDLEAIMGMKGNSKNLVEQLLFAGLRFGYRLGTGDDLSLLNPYRVAPQLPPRPLLFIYGSLEDTAFGARETLAHVRAAHPEARAALWVVPGAGHGDYVAVAGEAEYLRHALPLYDCALLERCAAWDQMWGQE